MSKTQTNALQIEKKKTLTITDERKVNNEQNLFLVRCYIGLSEKEKIDDRSKHLRKAKLLESQKLVLQGYYQSYRSSVRQVSTYTLLSNFQKLFYFANFVKKEFLKVTRADIESYISYAREQNYSEGTICGQLSVIKSFFKWLYQTEDTFPEVVRWLKPRMKLKERKMSELLTPEEIRKLVEVSTNSRDKALIAILYESGCRISEILTLSYDGIAEQNGFFKITVTGKTGTRTIQLLYSSEYLKDWLNNHPFRSKFEDNPDLPIFISLYHSGGRKLTYAGANEILRKAVRLSDIKKHVHFHLFRHSRGTELNLKGFNEKDLRIFMGHSKTSPMPSYYSHYGEEEVSTKLKKMYGLVEEIDEVEEKRKFEALKPVICKNCKSSNPATSLYCTNCSGPLNEKALKKEKARLIMNQLFQDDEFIEVFDKYLLKKKLKGFS